MLIANIAPRSMGKTTGTGWMLHALHERGRKARGYDADHSKQLYTWATGLGNFPMPVELAATGRFHKTVTPPQDTICVVDCGHTENHPDITDSVLRLADLVICHTAASYADLERLVDPPVGVPVADMVARTAPLRADGKAPPAWALLNRTVPGAKSTREGREWLEDEGWQVLSTVIPRREDFAQSMGLPVTGAASTQFGELITELEQKGLLK